MDIIIKAVIERLIAEYHQLNKELEGSTRAANHQYKKGVAENVYTDEYLRNTLDTAINNANSYFAGEAAALNAKARQSVAELKAKLIPALSTSEHIHDYAVKVNNALQFVQLEGADIDDETAAQILHDFTGDMEIMQRFRNVIERQKGEKLSDAFGNTTFPLTFGRLYACERFIEAMAELEGTAEKLFIRGKTETETEFSNSGKKLSVPMDCYMQLMSARNIVEQAGTVEAMAAELFKVSD